MTTLPEWQRGYDLDLLKQYTAVFDAHDEGLVRSRFGRTSERTVAEALAAGGLLALGSPPTCVVIFRRARSQQWIRDYTGAERARVSPGELYVKRFAGPPLGVLALLEELRAYDEGRCWFESWTESEADRYVLEALEARPVLTKIRASSEMITVSSSGEVPVTVPLHEAEAPSLCRLEGDYNEAGAALLSAFAAAGSREFAGHYSAYGKGWAALSLRGYAPPGQDADPDFIIKPPDMAKAWKAENAEKLEWRPEWSALGQQLLGQLSPYLAGLVDDDLDRVRLMALAPGGGEIERHADIVDREAGVRDGMVVRLHYPLRTNLRVIFGSWDASGQEYSAHMGEGECWYLDIRKPHTAINGGAEPRIHLVVDVRSSPLLRSRLVAAEHARPVQWDAAVPA